MAEERFTFNAQDADALLQSLGANGSPGQRTRYKSGAYIAVATSGIAGRSGTTVTFTDCAIWAIDGTTLSSTGISLPVGNLSTTAVATGAYIICLYAGGGLVCNWEDC